MGLRGQVRLDLNAVAVQEDFSAANWLFVPGGSLGVRFPLGRRTFLFPEVVLLVPHDFESERWQSRVLQGGIGLQWGSGPTAAGSVPPP